MALDILPCQASSVPCERLFSASKQTAENRRASLGENRFEELQVMKFAWRPKIEKATDRNSEKVEEVDLDDIDEYTEMLEVDESAAEFDRIEDELILVD
jgi:hAT family C-terminal dimerisation region